MAELPSGTVTTDIAGSTQLLREHRDGYARARTLLREAVDEAHAIDDRDGLVAALVGLGVAAGRSAAVGGIALVAAADALVEDAGGRHGAFESRMRNEAVGAARHALGAACFDDA